MEERMAESTHEAEVLATVDRFYAALEACDLPTCEQIFTDDAVVWRCVDRIERSKAEALAEVAGMLQHVHFEIVRRYVVPDGCVQQHVVSATNPAGETEIPAVHRICCEGGRISRIEEYFDSAQIAAFAEQLAAPRG
jgi:ketosteroid isomerase-like protein